MVRPRKCPLIRLSPRMAATSLLTRPRDRSQALQFPLPPRSILADMCLGQNAPAACAPSTAQISISADGSPLLGVNRLPSISADARFVAFESLSSSTSSDARYIPARHLPGHSHRLRSFYDAADAGRRGALRKPEWALRKLRCKSFKRIGRCGSGRRFALCVRHLLRRNWNLHSPGISNHRDWPRLERHR